MIEPFLAVLAILLLLILSEYLWRNKFLTSEISRKLVHIIVGGFVAFWPLFMGWGYIELISLAFVVVVLISMHYKLFRSIHSVDRSTLGEISFALAIGLLAVFVHTKWIFAASVLHLSLADGLAAILGTHLGHSNTYRVFKDKKSVAGSVTFFVVSFLILLTVAIGWGSAPWTILIWLPLLATLVENLSVSGTDNLFVPLLVAVSLRFLL